MTGGAATPFHPSMGQRPRVRAFSAWRRGTPAFAGAGMSPRRAAGRPPLACPTSSPTRTASRPQPYPHAALAKPSVAQHPRDDGADRLVERRAGAGEAEHAAHFVLELSAGEAVAVAKDGEDRLLVLLGRDAVARYPSSGARADRA